MTFLQPAVRKGPRYSVRPFYATILVFTTLAVLSLAWDTAGNGQVHLRTTAGVPLFKRKDEPEVPQLRRREVAWKLNDTLCDFRYSVA